jgi:hypothetical protein
MSSDLFLAPLGQALTALPDWLAPTAAAATIVIVVLPTLVWAAVVLVALFTRHDKRAERALRILTCLRSSRQGRSR